MEKIIGRKSELEDAPMRDEYRSVFKSPERYMDIVKALSANKSGLTRTEYYSFRSKDASPKVQIDLIIDRSDDFVDIIEIKYSRIRYEMTKEESEKIERRSAARRTEMPMSASVS